MGLDLRTVKRGERCLSMPYSCFGEMRKRIASAVGIDLDEMVGFGGEIEWSTVAEKVGGLASLLNHSDCDGWLWRHECEAIEPDLRKIVEAWPVDDLYREQGLRLCDAMGRIAREETDEFGIEFS